MFNRHERRESRGPITFQDIQLQIISANSEALGDIRTALGNMSLTAPLTPQSEELFYSAGHHLLMLGGNLAEFTEGLDSLVGSEVPVLDDDPRQLILGEALPRIGQLAQDIGRDDLYLEIEPEEGSPDLTLRQKADIVLMKLAALEEFSTLLPEFVGLADNPTFKQRVLELNHALTSKKTIGDKYEEFRQTPRGKKSSRILLGNVIFGVGGTAAVQIMERRYPGFGEFVRDLPALGWLYVNVLLSPYYKFISAAAAVANSPISQDKALARDRKKDIIRFSKTDKSIELSDEPLYEFVI